MGTVKLKKADREKTARLLATIYILCTILLLIGMSYTIRIVLEKIFSQEEVYTDVVSDIDDNNTKTEKISNNSNKETKSNDKGKKIVKKNSSY